MTIHQISFKYIDTSKISSYPNLVSVTLADMTYVSSRKSYDIIIMMSYVSEKLVTVEQLFYDGGRYHIETSPV